MSLLDDVSIVVTPNGYKAGELYAVIPSDGAADMDVTRATDATRVDENGLIADVLANVPRIDYTGGGCPHILAEPQRTNLITQSENFSSYLSNATQELNSNISPSGMLNASNVYPTTSGSTRGISSSVLGIAATEYTISIFAKSNGKNFVFCTNVSNSLYGVWFDLSNGSVSGSDASNAKIISYGNDWYKLLYTSTSTSTTIWSRFLISETNGSTSVIANGTDGVLFWGAQVEAGSYATSYIPTSGSTVTRNQDEFSRDGITSLINSTEGTLVIEPRYFINDGSARKISISDGTGANRIYITPYQGLASRIRYIFTSGGSTQADLQVTGIDITVSRKLAFVWATNRFELWQNGVKISEDTSGTTPSAGTFNQINFSSETGGGADPFEGELKQLQVYKTALTDTQLAALTS